MQRLLGPQLPLGWSSRELGMLPQHACPSWGQRANLSPYLGQGSATHQAMQRQVQCSASIHDVHRTRHNRVLYQRRARLQVEMHDSLPGSSQETRPTAPKESITLTEDTQASSSTSSSGTTTATASSVREQERELAALSTIPSKEQGYEGLAAWVGLAMAFGGGIWYVQGAEKAQEYFAGYLLEQSLSVDNLFVFILVFNYFKTPQECQDKVLTWGILSAAVLRAVFIIAGVELIDMFQPLLIGFSAILIFSSYKILAAGDDDEEDEDLTDNAVVRFCRRFIPATDHYDGDNFWTTASDGTRLATPLLLTLAVVELSDVLFAVDSIPAVFGVTLDPFIIYSSNMFAILSLRALYKFVANVMSELRFLDKAVAVVLGFIGAKMLLGFADVEVPTDVSLLVVGVLLGGGVAASLLLPQPAESD